MGFDDRVGVNGQDGGAAGDCFGGGGSSFRVDPDACFGHVRYDELRAEVMRMRSVIVMSCLGPAKTLQQF